MASAIPATARMNTVTDMPARYTVRRRRANSLWAEARSLGLLTGSMTAAFDAAALGMKRKARTRREMKEMHHPRVMHMRQALRGEGPWQQVRDSRTLVYMEFWFPVLSHPAAGGPPWFVVDEAGAVRRCDGHPMGASPLPSFHVVEGLAYATGADHAESYPWGPWFAVQGSMVSRAHGHPDGPSCLTLYQQRRDEHATA